MAKLVSYVHTFAFVHKNICPESILILDDVYVKFTATPPRRNPCAFLAGFESFRSAAGKSVLQGDDDWERNIYRHPQKQGAQLSRPYKLQHDIYSLGVCLLEVGLWESFIVYSTATPQRNSKPQPEKPSKGLFTWLRDKNVISQDYSSGFEISSALMWSKDYMVELAKTRLPQKAGDKYAEIVTTCLTCLDEEDNEFGEETEFADEYGIKVGMRYIEAIHIALSELVI